MFQKEEENFTIRVGRYDVTITSNSLQNVRKKNELKKLFDILTKERKSKEIQTK